MAMESICLLKKEHHHLSEEETILSNPKMAEAIEESDKAKVKGVKAWKLKV